MGRAGAGLVDVDDELVAKRAAENAALASGVKPTAASAPAGSGFGLGGGAGAAPGGPSAEELASLQKFLGRR